MSKRRIAFYTSSDCYGGLEKNVLQFMEWLTIGNTEAVLLSPEEYSISKAAARRNIPLVSPVRTNRYVSLNKALQLKKILHENTIDILFIIRPRDILLAALTKIFFYRKLKLVYFQQSGLRLKKHPLLYSFLFRPYDAWITPSDYLREKALELAHFKPERLYVIPPCIDTEYYENDTLTRTAARKLLNLPADRIFIGTIGRYDLKRKQDFLIRSVQLLHRNNYDVDLLIMGKTEADEENEYYKFLNILVKECEVEKYVYFRNYSDKMITFFRAVDFFIMNWAGEPYDLILLKAMASKVPVVARHSDHNTELLENGKFGLLYRPDDLEDLTSKIIHLLTQNRLVNHLKEVSMANIREKYDKKSGCNKLEKLIDTIYHKS